MWSVERLQDGDQALRFALPLLLRLSQSSLALGVQADVDPFQAHHVRPTLLIPEIEPSKLEHTAGWRE